jgi:hypothetical protein
MVTESLSCVVIDDELHTLEMLKSFICKISHLKLIASFEGFNFRRRVPVTAPC